MDTREHYRTLQIDPDATQAEIKSAYRRLAKQMHPDSQGQRASHEAIVRLNAAYEVLSDRHRRQTYDHQQTVQTRSRSTTTRRQPQDSDGNLVRWIEQIYRPINRIISQIQQPLTTQIDELSADPFDDELMDTFVDYVTHCQTQLSQAQQRLRTLPNPSIVAATAANLYYCLNHLEDGLNELNWFTHNYDEHYLHTGIEFFRLAHQLQQEAQRRLPSIV